MPVHHSGSPSLSSACQPLGLEAPTCLPWHAVPETGSVAMAADSLWEDRAGMWAPRPHRSPGTCHIRGRHSAGYSMFMAWGRVTLLVSFLPLLLSNTPISPNILKRELFSITVLHLILSVLSSLRKAMEKWYNLSKQRCAFAYLALDLLVLETKSDFITFYFF